PVARRWRARPAEPGPDHFALLPRPGGQFHVARGEREPVPEDRQQLPRLPGRPAVHGGQQRDLGVGPFPAERVGQRLVEVAGAGRDGPTPPPRHAPPTPAGPAPRAPPPPGPTPGWPTPPRPTPGGISAAPPPLAAPRPETPPPPTYSGWNRPPVPPSPSQDQPYAP